VIYGIVYSIVSAVLDGNSKALEYLAESPKDTAAPSPQSMPDVRQTAPSLAGNAVDTAKMTVAEAQKELAFDLTPVSEGTIYPYRKEEPVRLSVGSSSYAAPKEDWFEENKRELLEQEKKAKQERVDPKNLIYKGELFRTYLIYEEGDIAYLIDQHAAHERLIYNRLKARTEARQPLSQPMLVPYIYTANGQEYAFLEKNFAVLEELGFDIGGFGGTSVKISAVPVDLAGMNVQEFLGEVLSSMESLRMVKLTDIVKDKLATMACKVAVKGGELLTEAEARSLIEEMDGDVGLKCPHGRPACVKVKKSELEKLFKRTV